MQIDFHMDNLDLSSAMPEFYPEVEGTPCAPGGKAFRNESST